MKFQIDGVPVRLEQGPSPEVVHINRITPDNLRQEERPDFIERTVRLSADKPVRFALALRVPGWLAGPMKLFINGEPAHAEADERGCAVLERDWLDQELTVRLPKKITFCPLPDCPDTGAFLDGPVALAALTAEERTLCYDREPAEILTPYDERRWGEWLSGWKTVGQPVNLVFKPIHEIGHEQYTTYFPTEKRSSRQ